MCTGKKQLIFIHGTMGVGKSTVCAALQKRLTPSVYLDGDWCWEMEPFCPTQADKDMVMDNIVHLLRNFLHHDTLRYVLFSWVMHETRIIDQLLDRLPRDLFDLRVFTLVCTEPALRDRLQKDIRRGVRQADILARSLPRLALYQSMPYPKIDVSEQSAAQAAAAIASRVLGADDMGKTGKTKE